MRAMLVAAAAASSSSSSSRLLTRLALQQHKQQNQQQQVRCLRSFSSSRSMAREEQQQQQQNLQGLRIAMTTPQNYAGRLAEALHKEGAVAVACPTIQVERTPAMKQDFERVIWGVAADANGLSSFKGITFVSRSSIAAFHEALGGKPVPLPPPLHDDDDDEDTFLVGALGQDGQLVKDLGLFDFQGTQQPRQRPVKLVVPSIATPEGLVQELGDGCGRRLLCPVPLVQGLEEPPVVPAFLAGLKSRGWNPLRLNAYVTKWLGPDCIGPLLETPPPDALLLTSTAEVEGLLKSLSARNMSLKDVTRSRSDGKRCLVVAYGPVTADGAKRLGVRVDLVGHNFSSFVDLVGLIVEHFKKQQQLQP